MGCFGCIEADSPSNLPGGALLAHVAGLLECTSVGSQCAHTELLRSVKYLYEGRTGGPSAECRLPSGKV